MILNCRRPRALLSLIIKVMNTHNDEKLPTSTNSKDNNKNNTSNEDHIKLDGNYEVSNIFWLYFNFFVFHFYQGNQDKVLYSKGDRVKKSLTKVHNLP